MSCTAKGGLKFGAIAIGRNEGYRLKRCVQSLSEAAFPIYVDSGSNDGSVEYSRDKGVTVVELDSKLPFTAARARNAGFKCLRRKAPDLCYVQFVDGDCEVRKGWHQTALAFLESHKDVAVVCGRRRERHPEESIYNWLCDHEWDGPTGEVRACGGDAMMRVSAFEAVGGFRDDLIAGEEPELCLRLRGVGWRVWRLADEMTIHDAAMMRFNQWWRRAIRAGYAFAEGAYLHGAMPERHWVWESRRAWLWGVYLPLLCASASIVFFPSGLATWSIFPLQVLRQTLRNQGAPSARITLSLFQVLARFPEALGQLKFLRDRLFGLRAHLIEYK